MAYENVSVAKLQNSLQAIDQVMTNRKELERISNSLSASNWSGESRKRIKDAIDKTIEEYKKIDKYIERCKEAASYIAEYKEIDNKNKTYQAKVDSKNRQIKRAKEDDDTSSIKNEVQRYKNNISSNNLRKQELKNKIDNLIN